MNQFEMPYVNRKNSYPDIVPFYMTYPMPNALLGEREYDRDMEKMKELYPKRMRKILAYVEDECDKMEYEGSMMYDEYPDKIMLYCVAKKIYDAVMPLQENEMGKRERDRDFLDVIQVLLYDEIFRRRGRHRRVSRRWW